MATIVYKTPEGNYEEISVTEKFKKDYELLLIQEQRQDWKIKKRRQRAGLKDKRDISLEHLYELGYEIQSNEPDPLEICIAKERQEELHNTLLRLLTPKQREVYILHLQGFSQIQIAKKLKLVVSSVNERIRNAEKRISDYFLKNPKI